MVPLLNLIHMAGYKIYTGSQIAHKFQLVICQKKVKPELVVSSFGGAAVVLCSSHSPSVVSPGISERVHCVTVKLKLVNLIYSFQTFELPSFLNAQRIVWHSPFRSGKSEMEANRTGAGSMGFGGKE